jgi:hypothetical protein
MDSRWTAFPKKAEFSELFVADNTVLVGLSEIIRTKDPNHDGDRQR